MWIAILFILKALIIVGLLFYIALGLINMLVATFGGIIVKVSPYFEMPYIIIAQTVFVYLYGFFGSFYIALTIAYKGKLKDWLIYSVCIICLALYFKFSRKSLREERFKIANDPDTPTHDRDESGRLDPKLFQNLITIYGLRFYWIPIVAFSIFYFYPSLIQQLYGNMPLSIAKWFL